MSPAKWGKGAPPYPNPNTREKETKADKNDEEDDEDDEEIR